MKPSPAFRKTLRGRVFRPRLLVCRGLGPARSPRRLIFANGRRDLGPPALAEALKLADTIVDHAPITRKQDALPGPVESLAPLRSRVRLGHRLAEFVEVGAEVPLLIVPDLPLGGTHALEPIDDQRTGDPHVPC